MVLQGYRDRDQEDMASLAEEQDPITHRRRSVVVRSKTGRSATVKTLMFSGGPSAKGEQSY